MSVLAEKGLTTIQQSFGQAVMRGTFCKGPATRCDVNKLSCMGNLICDGIDGASLMYQPRCPGSLPF